MSLKRIIAFIMLVVMAVSCAFAEESEELTHDVCAVVAVAKVKDWDTDTLVTSDTTKLSFTDLAGAIIKLDFAKLVQMRELARRSGYDGRNPEDRTGRQRL